MSMHSRSLRHFLLLNDATGGKRLAHRRPGYLLSSRSRNTEPDALLMKAIVAGDRSALGEIYNRYAGILVSLAERIFGSRAEAEDLMQDVFLEAWKKAPTYDPTRGSVRTWLLIRMRSRAQDRLNLYKVRYRHQQALGMRLAAESELIAHGPKDKYFIWLMRRAVLALPPRQRQLVGLLYVSGFSGSEVAESLNCPVGTIKSRSSQLLRRLGEVTISSPCVVSQP